MKRCRLKALWWVVILVLGLGIEAIVSWQQSYTAKEAREETEQAAMTATSLATLNEQLGTLSALLARPAAPPFPAAAERPSKLFNDSSSAPEVVSTESVKVCSVIMLLVFSGPKFHHPGYVTWNFDGTWTISNWQTLQEAAKLPDDKTQPIDTIAITIAMARALLKEHAANKLLESNNSAALCNFSGQVLTQ